MTMTDEPGYYDENRGFGIRIENTMNILFAWFRNCFVS